MRWDCSSGPALGAEKKEGNRCARFKLRWLLSACLISLLLLTPTDCKGLNLVGAIRSSILWPPPPTSSLAIRQDESVEQLWLSCALDLRIPQDVGNKSHPTLLFDTINNSYRTNNKKSSHQKISAEQVITTISSPAKVASTFLYCLNRNDIPAVPHGVSEHGQKLQEKMKEARSVFPNSNTINKPSIMKRKILFERVSADVASTLAPSHYSFSPPAKQARRSVFSSKPEADPLAVSIKKAAKPVPKNKSKDSSLAIVAGLSVACIALMALFCLCCCACRGNDSSESSYDLRDDKPLLSLNLSDMSGSSRKSSATQIDVSRLGALSRSSSQSQNNESSLPIKTGKVAGREMSMRLEFERRSNIQAMKLSSHEITTIAGQPAVSASSLGGKAAGVIPSANASTSACAPTTGPTPPPAPPLPKALCAPTAAPAPPPPERSAPPPPGPPPPPAPRAAAGPGPPPPPAPVRARAGPPPPAIPGAPKPRGPPPLKKPGNVAGPQPSDSNKTKLKPFFWDKVNASPNQAMVWDQIKAGSFQFLSIISAVPNIEQESGINFSNRLFIDRFNEEMIESLFGCHSTAKKDADGKKDSAVKDATQLVRILEAKKAQNLAISLKALSVSAEEVRNAAMEGHELPSDLIQTLIRWTPTSDEELRLRLYTGEITQLGPAEQFLRTIIDIPYIFQRLDILLFMSSLPEEAANVEQSFKTLEVACEELRLSRLFKKLLEAVLKTGNRMNDGTFRGGAQAFKLDTLLKLADVKGVDGKTTLLHFVVQEIIRSEGVRAMRASKEQVNSSITSVNSEDLSEDVADDTEHYKQLGLNVVSSLGEDLQNVRKAACLDSDALTISVASLGHRLVKANEFLNTSMKSLDEDSGFHRKLGQFIEQSQAQVTHLLEEEKKLRSLVRSTVDYFHGSTGKDEGLRLFIVVRDFLSILDKVCREVKEAAAKAAAGVKKPTATAAGSRSRQSSETSLSFRDPRQHLVPAIQDRRGAAAHSSSSSDSDDDS